MSSQYFMTLDNLIGYLYSKTNHLSPVKLHKSLYFLYAYYAAMYGAITDYNEREMNYDLPPKLFDAEFQAWHFGSVIKEVYVDGVEGEAIHQAKSQQLPNNLFSRYKNGLEVKLFIDGLFDEIRTSSDFALVDRNHADECWRKAFEQGNGTVIDNDVIIQEYRQRFAFI